MSLSVGGSVSGKNKTQKMQGDCVVTASFSVFGLKVHRPTLYTTHIGGNLTAAVKLEP